MGIVQNAIIKTYRWFETLSAKLSRSKLQTNIGQTGTDIEEGVITEEHLSELETLTRLQADLINGLTDQVNKLLRLKEVSTLKLEKTMR